MSADNSDAVLGNQGSQDFTALTSGAPGGNGVSSNGGGAENVAAKSDAQQTSLPQKTAEQTDTNQQQQAAGGNVVTPQQTGQQQQAQQPGQSQADIIKATAEAVAQTFASQRQAERQEQTARANQPKTLDQLSEDEFSKKFNVVRVTPQHMTAILDQDPAKGAAAMNAIIQGAVHQALLMSTEVNAAHAATLRNEVKPHIASWTAYQAQQRDAQEETAFFKAHPDLANEREIVKDMRDALETRVKSGQLQFKNLDEAYSAVANATRTTLTRMGWKPGGGSQQTQAQTTGQQTQQQSTRQMSAASSAGRTGTGQAAAKSVVEEVFGADAR